MVPERLLEKLSLLLSGQNYRPTGAPLPMMRTELSLTQVSSAGGQYPTKNSETIQLALDTLATFDFAGNLHFTFRRFRPISYICKGHQLNDFVRTCALPYLEDEQPEIRLRAATTCCRLFMRDASMHYKNTYSLEIINEVLEKLLMVSIADNGT